MLWHEQSWPQIKELPKQLPVVVPLGSCEQHGHHLPLFVDTIQVTSVAQRVEERMKDRMLLTPVLWLGSSHHHLDFPGTISVRPSLYSQMIQEVARSIIAAGFKRIFFLNGHGGNEVPASLALSELVATEDSADDCYLSFASWWRVGAEGLKPARHGAVSPEITHACEYETSFMLFLRPDLVKHEKAREASPVLDRKWNQSEMGGRVRSFRRFHRLTAAGSMGRPKSATAEKGRSMFEAVVDEVVGFLDDFAKWPELPAIGPAGP